MLRNVPRILIADDHTLVAEACKKLLESEYEIVATVGDGRALVRAAVAPETPAHHRGRRHGPAERTGCGAAGEGVLTSVKLLFLTMNHDADLAAEAFRR